MDLNDFVVPNNKTRSVKLNARNLQKLQLDTTALASESKEMEEKLEQLKENMSKEKEERGYLRDFRWRFGQCMSSNSNSQPNSFKRTNDNKIQKLSAGKLKIRVLKDESLSAPPQSASSPSVPSSGLGMTRRSRVKGKISRQEIKTAKLTDAQAHVICQDVSCFQRQINPGSSPNAYNPESTASPDSNHSITSPTITRREDESSKKGTKVKEKQMKIPDICSQVPVVKHGQEKAVGVTADDRRESANLFTGPYSEEESARSFQEALLQWRKERSEGIGKLVPADVLWTPVRPASVSAMSTQTDLPPDREAEGQKREGAERKLTVKLEFSENSLTYMDRLVLKKHRRTPVESPSPAFGMDFKSLPTTDTEEEMAISLTAEEEDFHQYCSSLFSVPVSQDRTEPQLSTPELCLVIEVLDEVCRDMKKVSFVEKKLDNNRIVSAVQQISGMEQTEMSQTPLFVHRASEAGHSSPHPPQPSRPSITSVQPKTDKMLHCPNNQNSKIDNSLKASLSRAFACTTARTKKSPKTPNSNSSRSICSSSITKSNANFGSPQFVSSLPDSQFKTHKSSQPPVLFLPDVSVLDATTSIIPQDHLSTSSSTSFPLRSTFSVSPSSSAQSVLLPMVYHSTPQQNGTEKKQSLQLFAETISSLNPYETPRGNLISPQQFQLSCSDQDCLPLDNQLTQSLSPATVKPQLTSKALEPIISIGRPAPNNGPSYICPKSLLKFEDAPVLKCLVSTPSCEKTLCTSPYCISDLSDNPVETEEDKEFLEDSEDEMTIDSLTLTPPEEDFCRAQIHGRSPREKTRETNNLEMSHPDDSFKPEKQKQEKVLQTEATKRQPEPQMVMKNQTAGFGSEQFCDLDGFSPLGLDTDTGRPDPPEQTHCDRLHTCQFSMHDSDPTVGCSHSSLGCGSEEYLVCEMKDSYLEPTRIQIHSTGREEMSANELRTSEFGLARCPLSQASQAIMEICSVDQTGCEDPDVDTDITARMMHSMEQELRLAANTPCICVQALGLESGDSQGENQDYSHLFKWGGPSKEENQKEETAETDRQNVLLLP